VAVAVARDIHNNTKREDHNIYGIYFYIRNHIAMGCARAERRGSIKHTLMIRLIVVAWTRYGLISMVVEVPNTNEQLI
jgi:hypothetical protein